MRQAIHEGKDTSFAQNVVTIKRKARILLCGKRNHIRIDDDSIHCCWCLRSFLRMGLSFLKHGMKVSGTFFRLQVCFVGECWNERKKVPDSSLLLATFFYCPLPAPPAASGLFRYAFQDARPLPSDKSLWTYSLKTAAARSVINNPSRKESIGPPPHGLSTLQRLLAVAEITSKRSGGSG